MVYSKESTPSKTVFSLCCCPWRTTSRSAFAFGGRGYPYKAKRSEEEASNKGSVKQHSEIYNSTLDDDQCLKSQQNGENKPFKLVDSLEDLNKSVECDRANVSGDKNSKPPISAADDDKYKQLIARIPKPMTPVLTNYDSILKKPSQGTEASKSDDGDGNNGKDGETNNVNDSGSVVPKVSQQPEVNESENKDEIIVGGKANDVQDSARDFPKVSQQPEVNESENADENKDEIIVGGKANDVQDSARDLPKVSQQPEVNESENMDGNEDKVVEAKDSVELPKDNSKPEQNEMEKSVAKDISEKVDDEKSQQERSDVEEKDKSLVNGEVEPTESSDEKEKNSATQAHGQNNAKESENPVEDGEESDKLSPLDILPKFTDISRVTPKKKSNDEVEKNEIQEETAFISDEDSKEHSKRETDGMDVDSISSVYSSAGGGKYGVVKITGDVLLKLHYDSESGTFQVHVEECRNLAAVDAKRHRSDPHVKVYLLPDKSKRGKRKTKSKKYTLNPVFNEIMRFKITIGELQTRTLWITVWHTDFVGQNHFLGEVTLPLGVELFDMKETKWYPLQDRLDPSEYQLTSKGYIDLSVKFVPPDAVAKKDDKKRLPKQETGALHVLIREGRGLVITDRNSLSDPFCKGYLLPDKSKSGKRKTPVVKNTLNPKWNHTMVFGDVLIEELKERCVELTVWDFDRMTSNEFLGGLRLNLGIGKCKDQEVCWMDAEGEELRVWAEMLDKPNEWIEATIPLRASMFVDAGKGN